MEKRWAWFFGILVLAALILGLIYFITNHSTSVNYLRGQILVGFNDDVSAAEADSLVKSFGLTWESKFPKLFGIWLEYNSSETSDSKEIIMNRIVEEDKKLAQSPYTNYLVLNTRVVNNDKILVMFNNRATEEQAKQFLSRFKEVEFDSFDYASKYGVVFVPRGEEQKWIQTFEKESIIRYAEL